MDARVFIEQNPPRSESVSKILELKEKIRIERLVKAFETCQICFSKLWFEYQTDKRKNLVHECAECTSCGTKGKIRSYKMV